MPRFEQRTAYGRQLRAGDLLVDLREEVTDVFHGNLTHVRFLSGGVRSLRPWQRFQVIRDGRRTARAWLLETLATTELSEATARALPWFLADALDHLLRSGRVTRTFRGTFARAA